MRFPILFTLLAAGIGGAMACAGAFGQKGQVVTPPKARYAMDVGTVTGFAAMGGRGGGSMLGAVLGGGKGGGGPVHELRLRLGSSQAPAGGTARADHFFEPRADLGASVPLLAGTPSPDSRPDSFQRPKGRLLVYWGCGERAGPGQPVVIDFAKLAAGQVPPGLFSTSVPVDPGPTAGNSKSYGEWPNAKSTRRPGSGSSLIGQHRVAGTYSPDIGFALTQDYMAGLTARSSPLASGATGLSWNGVPAATGYYAWVFGAKGMSGNMPQDMVWWTSSATREFGGGLWDWLPPATVARLIASKVVMPPSQTSCTVPAEVKAAAPDFMMGNLFAYGPEANFVHPPRPANPKTPWNQEWSARVRYRSHTGFMIGGPDLAGMGAGEEDAARSGSKKKCKRGGLGGVLGGAVGGVLGRDRSCE